MGELPKKDVLQLGENGRIDINELKSRLQLPSPKWIIDSGGGPTTSYLWFIGPAAMDTRELGEIYRDVIGSLPLKWNKETGIKGPFHGQQAADDESWFCVELSPTMVDLPLIQNFVDKLHGQMEFYQRSQEPNPTIETTSDKVREGLFARLKNIFRRK